MVQELPERALNYTRNQKTRAPPVSAVARGLALLSAKRSSLEPVFACGLTIARYMNGHRDGQVPEVLGEGDVPEGLG